MAFEDTPSVWLGAGASLASSTLSLTTRDDETAISTMTVVAATDVITVGATHNLKVGQVVRFTTSDTLPAGLSTSTDYFVLTVPSTTTLTVSASLNGAVVDITDTGTGTHNIVVMGALQELTDAEAHMTTGDVRKIYFAIAEKMYQDYIRTDTADRPSQMTFSRSNSINETTGITSRTYTLQFNISGGTPDVIDE